MQRIKYVMRICVHLTAYHMLAGVSCGGLYAPVHGKIEQFSDSEATFGCDDGYTLKGKSTLVCQNGEWGTIPTCKGIVLGILKIVCFKIGSVYSVGVG